MPVKTMDPEVKIVPHVPTAPEPDVGDGMVRFKFDRTKVYPSGSKDSRKISMPDPKADTGVSAVIIPNEAIERNGDSYIITIDPKQTYKINRRTKDEDGVLGFEKDEIKGDTLLKHNDKALEEYKAKQEAEAQGVAQDTVTPPKKEVYNKELADESKAKTTAKSKGKGALAGAAAGAAVAKAANEGEKKTSIGHKIAKGAGFATAIAGGAVVAGAAASQVTMRKGFENPIAEGVGQLLMANASNLDRRMPAIGVPPDPKDRRAGYEFDM